MLKRGKGTEWKGNKNKEMDGKDNPEINFWLRPWFNLTDDTSHQFIIL